MIQSFRHKGLKRFYQNGDTSGLNPQQIMRIRAILARLDASTQPTDMNQPGSRLHSMKGKLAGFWAVNISGNWRIIFRFEDNQPFDVDLIDYH